MSRKQWRSFANSHKSCNKGKKHLQHATTYSEVDLERCVEEWNSDDWLIYHHKLYLYLNFGKLLDPSL